METPPAARARARRLNDNGWSLTVRDTGGGAVQEVLLDSTTHPFEPRTAEAVLLQIGWLSRGDWLAQPGEWMECDVRLAQHDLGTQAKLLFHTQNLPGVDLLTTPSGLSCRRTEDDLTWHVADRGPFRVHLNRMLVNWRVTVQHHTNMFDVLGGWCYFGLGFPTFCRALEAAHAWRPDLGEEAPQGFDKEAFSVMHHVVRPG